MTGLISVSYFLVNLFFSLILFLLWLRIILRYFKISVLNPAASQLYGLSNPIITPFERLVYPVHPPRYDWITLSAIMVVEFIKFLLLGLLVYKQVLPAGAMLIFILADLVVQPCDLFFYALLFRVILSWMNPQWQHHPASNILNRITDPLIAIGHRIIPDISGFDFAPFIIMIILKVITMFISASIAGPLI